MKVKLLAHTPEPEKVISMAAKLCYSPVGVDEIAENLTQESINKFLKASIIYYFLLGFYLKKIHNTISNYKNISK